VRPPALPKMGRLVRLWDMLESTLRDVVVNVRGLPRLTDLPIKVGRLGILSYKKTVVTHPYADSDGGGRRPSPCPHTRSLPGQYSTHYPTPTLPGDLYRERGVAGLADPRAGQRHHRSILQAGRGDAIPALPALDRLQVAAALQLPTWLANGRPTAPSAVSQTSSGTPWSAARESRGV
jgi:hypothetical protein